MGSTVVPLRHHQDEAVVHRLKDIVVIVISMLLLLFYTTTISQISSRHLSELVESPLLSVVVSVAKDHLAKSIICPIIHPDSEFEQLRCSLICLGSFQLGFSLPWSGILCTLHLGLAAKVVCDGVNRVDT